MWGQKLELKKSGAKQENMKKKTKERTERIS